MLIIISECKYTNYFRINEQSMEKSCIFAEETMDRATFESQKAFAGEKKPSMQRRCVDNDYTARRMYMVTMVTEGRKPLFGKVVGRSEALEPSAEAPHIELSPLGKDVAQIWQTIGSHHPEVKVVALQRSSSGALFPVGYGSE